jgi:hypothetical protein
MSEHRGEDALPAGDRPAQKAKRSLSPGDWSNPANWFPLAGAERALPNSSEVVIFSTAKDKPESKQG